MTETVKGFVDQIKVVTNTSKKTGKPFTLYNVILQDAKTGDLSPSYGFGFDAPAFKEGDYVKFDVAPGRNPKYLDYVKGTHAISKNPPAKPAAPKPAEKAASGGYNSPERQRSITYQSSRKDAIELVRILTEAKALPTSVAEGKAGVTKRFDDIQDAVDKFTVKFFHDVETLRLLETVVDAGEPVKAEEAPLPDADEAEKPQGEFDDLETPEDFLGDDDDEF